MKSRFSFLDITATTFDLQNLISSRLNNIYDLNQKQLVFRFQLDSGEKKLLLIESGIRLHETNFLRETKDISGFNVKLRKHLKGKRLISITQLGLDRRLDLQFAEGDYAHHLILEFFSSGNIILTDKDHKILSLMRIVQVEGEIPIKVNQIYQLDLNKHQVENVSEADESQGQHTEDILSRVIKPISDSRLQEAMKLIEQPESTLRASKKKSKKANTLKSILRTNLGFAYGPSLIDHAIACAGLDPSSPSIENLLDCNSPDFQNLLQGFKASDEIIKNVALTSSKGYILAKTIDGSLVYDEFHPFKPNYAIQDPSIEIIEFESFALCLDEFFSKVESQRYRSNLHRFEHRAKQAELQAEKKLQAVKESSLNLIKNLQLSQQEKELHALAIECNINLVDSAIKTICSFVASGMDWIDLNDLVKAEREVGNPLAITIKELKLDVGMITLELPDPNFQFEDLEEGDLDDSDGAIDKDLPRLEKKVLVDVDIYATAYANASSYYGEKKKAFVKEQKSVIASKKTIELAEKRVTKAIEKQEAVGPNIIKLRNPYWFEKFNWFLSSENFLVLSGKDPTQTELLCQKYLSPQDFFVHSEMEGSGIVLVKKLDKEHDGIIPPTTLLQAGTMSICQSKAWESKITTSAFWVTGNQITKTSFAGDCLPIGQFNLQRNVKKNYLPPVQLIYGIGLLFQVSVENIAKHANERRPWARDGSIEEMKKELQSLEEAELAIEKNIEEENSFGYNSQKIGGSAEFDADIEENTSAISGDDKEPSKPGVNLSELENNTIHPAEIATSSNVHGSSSKKAIKTAVPRGKKAKMKKINAKYADQDEDDRQLAIELLGSAKGPQPKGKKAKAIAEKQRIKEEATPELEAEKGRKPKNSNHQRVSVSKAEVEVDLESLAVNLDCLTGLPADGDEILACLPVCAPWTVLQKYKYRIKLLPGSLKKGKGAKSAQASFIAMATKAKAQKELEAIRSVLDQAWIDAMIAKTKLETKI